MKKEKKRVHYLDSRIEWISTGVEEMEATWNSQDSGLRTN